MVLARAKLEGVVCRDIDELCTRYGEGAGVALIAEEALDGAAVQRLSELVARQAAWSDFPFIVFGARSTDSTSAAVTALSEAANVTLLDRPVRVLIMVSAVRAAIRSRRRQYEARRAISQRDQFLAMLGHELRNPLGAILLATDMLERTGAATPSVQRHHAVIGRQARNLRRLVDDLLDVSRVTSGKVALKKSSVDLRDVVSRSIQTAAGDGQSATASRLKVTLPAESVIVDGDPVRLEQVVNNLLSNALKYTPDGGGVFVSLERAGDQALIKVRDEGIGIAKELLPRVFDIFLQAESALHRSQGGMGIGLTLVRTLAELHGGSVQASSKGLGLGSEFVVRLPVSASQPAAIPVAVVQDKPSRSRSVVLIEDSDDIRETLREALVDAGHHATAAADGKAGLGMLLSIRPEVAVVDIGLPGLDGYEVARRARASLGAEIRLIALSGYGRPEDQRRALAAGFDAHLTKPVDLETLWRLIVA
jgi:signal transduction histidine kinase/CheY-like chemotaxis protein